MKTMQSLIKREFWEHKGSFFWAPLVISSLVCVLFALAQIFVLHAHSSDGTPILEKFGVNAYPADVAAFVSGHYLLQGFPLFFVMGGAIFFYCLSALFDDRRDRSILFWRSLPISEQATVLSKALMALCIAPAIGLAFAIAAGLVCVLLGVATAAFGGINIAGPLLSSAGFYLAPAQILGVLPIYVLWALPSVGWLLLVSAWAKSKPFLWAIGVPVVLVLLAHWMNRNANLNLDLSWLGRDVLGRGLLGTLPGGWLRLDTVLGGASDFTHGNLLQRSWQAAATPELWIGAAIGCVMLYAAIWVRRWREVG